MAYQGMLFDAEGEPEMGAAGDTKPGGGDGPKPGGKKPNLKVIK